MHPIELAPQESVTEEAEGVREVYDRGSASLYHIHQATCFFFELYMILFFLAPGLSVESVGWLSLAWWALKPCARHDTLVEGLILECGGRTRERTQMRL